MILRQTWAVCLLYGLFICSSYSDDSPQDTPQDIFYKLYITLADAEKAEKKEDFAAALDKFQDVNKGLTDIKKRFPDWEPAIINFRLKYVHDKITNLREKVDNTPTTTAPVTPTPITPLPPPPAVVTPEEPMTPSPTSEDIGALHKRISDLESELATTKNLLVNAQLEISTLRGRLASAEKELNDARSTNVEDRIASILKENNDLKTQINDATLKIKTLQGGADANTLSQLRDQLQNVQDQLGKLSQENQGFRSSNSDLKEQLEQAQQRLAESAKTTGTSPNSDSLQQENEVLRDIVTRQLREQARRDAARKLAKEEIDNLQIKSDVLQKQIDILSSPLINIPADQLAMLRIPVATSISAPLPTPVTPPTGLTNTPANSTVTTPVTPPANPGLPTPTTTTQPNIDTANPPPAPVIPSQTPPPVSTPTDATANGTASVQKTNDLGTKAKVPDDMRDIASQAAELFKKGTEDPTAYGQSAALYNKILEKYPDCLYAWSNLGVVQFQQQHYPEAEQALQQAIRLNPNDAFAHSVLGIVYYQMGRFDDAIDFLTKSIALDPNDARSHNYLGIACSQKGWQEAAEKSLLKAIEIDPGYADAHFNLAVIYATQKPPMIEMAKKHYKMATDLGAPKDAQLGKILGP